MTGKLVFSFLPFPHEMMNNMTLYPAHSDAQVAHAANAYLLLIIIIVIYLHIFL